MRKEVMCVKTIKARYHNGVIEPLEQVHLPDDSDLVITIVDARGTTAPADEAPFSSLAGAWVGLVDCDQFLRDVYASRSQLSERPVAELEP